MANDAGKSFVEFGIPAENIAKLAKMVEDSTVGSSAASKILDAMVETNKDPMDLAKEMKLIQKSDAGELEAIVRSVFEANPQAVEDAKDGKKAQKSRGVLMGQVMRQSKGQANPKVAGDIIDRLLAE